MHSQHTPLFSQPGYEQLQFFKFFCFLHSIKRLSLLKPVFNQAKDFCAALSASPLAV
jgi:hypothetical protein